MEQRFRAVTARSLPPLVTAYPRVSKLVPDPSHGLASIEALITAAHIFGEDIGELCSRYRWAPEFLLTNATFFAAPA